MRVLRLLVLAAVPLVPLPATAQVGVGEEAPIAPAGRLSVVVLDRDALFARSAFGLRVQEGIAIASEELANENRRIEALLIEEEQTLSERRGEMDPDAFRTVADEFDTRVEGIRRAQEAKVRAIAQQSDRAQTLFFEQVNPILIGLARDLGALVILDRRSVIASADQVDITEVALERIDAELGDGSDLAVPDASDAAPRMDPETDVRQP